MKITITFKDPDAVYDAVQQAVHATMPEGIKAHETEMLAEFRHKDISDELKHWIRYGEYLTVEFDLETKTAKVLELAR